MVRFVLLIFILMGPLLGAAIDRKVPVLCYHRFAPEAVDSMTIKNSAFTEQMEWLKIHGYSVIPLDTAMGYVNGKVKTIPAKSVVITVDDGHKSVYSDMAPIVKKYKIPVTLFIYPSAISNAKYAMTWEQLRDLETTKLFHVESHTYWHPNFKKEKKTLSPEEYAKSVDKQLNGSKKKLEEKMGHEIKYLAWVFGIYDDALLVDAKKSGYAAAFTIDRQHASSGDHVMALGRYMVVSKHTIKDFERMVDGTEDRMSKDKKEVVQY
ncbi:polysaccharide deacetylase family protein [Sulfuricurvum sp. RIFCSPLOWO2_12_FULL_43_24]|uniref:polysaccharide deacetylase family protein n=1 Tax=Sulfuricurvum sp. RIFCSPLOWO2_12_FULL_43_24 TaxID=1802247 RepID=UPI0008B23E13|nr:polysaccharide deacetylase family protein [Sulfuricurvum sp. RIFCSPLOWO2_12_FULL_43_24]OHD87740.1 MAG: polysaccharide deacetylase [Sulfuricurvum sp. RIFCSPLOWO2_02_43_6]OHD89199.1 MAG: polysaccharide deacetylase [Sulfuricurvum sp. RIFCSPLOWO2_12_FULL_43_24]